MSRTIIVGAAGRMGRQLIADTIAADDLELAGAVDVAGSAAIGTDAGVLAGTQPCGIAVDDRLESCIDKADAVIDFSSPDAMVVNATTAVKAGCGVVIGTTGYPAEAKEQLLALTRENEGRMVLAPNMSIGVNLLFHLCEYAGRLLGKDYDIEITEMHHNRKKDAPSGTAARLGEKLAEASGRDPAKAIIHGRSGITGPRRREEIAIHALRGGDVVGEHDVVFAADGERITFGHKASSRQTFSGGALRAVRFLSEKGPGLYTMQDVLGIQ